MRAHDWDRKWRERLEHHHAEVSGQANRFLVAEIEGREPGRALDLACGAGRNAVWLAERGWRVTGVDFSAVALDEARNLAADRHVTVEWVEGDVLEWEPPAESFELVLVLYLQVPSGERRLVLEHASHALVSGGSLLVMGHHSDNLSDGWGGPSNPRVLYTAEELASDIVALDVERAERVLRPVATDDGEQTAIDALVIATAP